MKRIKTVRKLCSVWHDGQWSALYQFSSSMVYIPENHLQYLREIQENLEPEYFQYPGTISKKDKFDLLGCIDFFVNEGIKHGLKTDWYKHELYGYLIPYLIENTKEIKVNRLRLLA